MSSIGGVKSIPRTLPAPEAAKSSVRSPVPQAMLPAAQPMVIVSLPPAMTQPAPVADVRLRKMFVLVTVATGSAA